MTLIQAVDTTDTEAESSFGWFILPVDITDDEEGDLDEDGRYQGAKTAPCSIDATSMAASASNNEKDRSVKTMRVQRFCLNSPCRRLSLFNKEVLFSFDNVISNISCRNFETASSAAMDTGTQIWLSVQSFRILQDAKEGLRVDFKVYMVVQKKVITSWKRYTSFVEFARKCGIHSGLKRYFKSSSKEYPKSTASWNQIEKCRPWLRCLDVKYLVWKCCRLEDFLRNILFETSCLTDLTDFINLEEKRAV